MAQSTKTILMGFTYPAGNNIGSFIWDSERNEYNQRDLIEYTDEMRNIFTLLLISVYSNGDSNYYSCPATADSIQYIVDPDIGMPTISITYTTPNKYYIITTPNYEAYELLKIFMPIKQCSLLIKTVLPTGPPMVAVKKT